MVTCCEQLSSLADEDFLRVGPIHTLTNGRILTEIDTEYFLEFGPTETYRRPTYIGLHFCPFCGRALSRDLWNREKKK